MADDEKPWFTAGHEPSRAPACLPRPRERLWTLTKGTRQVDAELLFHAEDGVEVQFLFQGVMAHAQRYVLRAQAADEAEFHRQRLIREGWTAPA